MPRYIDADKLPELFEDEYKKTRRLIENGEVQLDNLAEGFTEATRVIRFVAKTEDVAPVVHAHWDYPFNRDIAKCSVCDIYVQDKINNVAKMYKYCPNCGARMDEETEDKEHDCK